MNWTFSQNPIISMQGIGVFGIIKQITGYVFALFVFIWRNEGLKVTYNMLLAKDIIQVLQF